MIDLRSLHTTIFPPKTEDHFSTIARALIPESLNVGMGGWIQLIASTASIASTPTKRGNSNVWIDSTSTIGIIGDGSRVISPKGWVVYCSGHSESAIEVSRLMDQIEFENRVDRFLSKEIGQKLCWSLLPVSVVVAVHPETGRVMLFRDFCGFRCLYYVFIHSTLYFSTCLASLRSLISPKGINTDKMSEMLVFGHRGGSRTIWQGINVVAPGSMVSFQADSRPRCESFFRPEWIFDENERYRLEQQSVTQTLEEIDQAFAESLEVLKSFDRIAVPGGGGVDSSLLGAYLAKRGQRVTFYSINQPEADRREAEWMEPLSKDLKVPFELVNITRERFLTTLIEMLSRTQHPLMGPNSIGGTLVHQQALEKGEQVFVNGELADTVFGGLSSFYLLSPRFRILNLLSRLPFRWRFWLKRGLSDLSTVIYERTQVVHGDALARIGGGSLERAEVFFDAQSVEYPKQSRTQRLADHLTFVDLKQVPGTLHHHFHERNESFAGTVVYPFAHPRLIRLGIHLPYYLKRRKGHNKWLWRTYAAPYIGKEAAFRKKYAFPTLTEKWLDRARSLLTRGFLEDLFCTRIDALFGRMPQGEPSRWTLLNLELWGRLHVWKESPDSLLQQLI